MFSGNSNVYGEQHHEILKRLGRDFKSIPVVPQRGFIDGNEFHQFMNEIIISKGFHFFQREVREGSWNLIVIGYSQFKQTLAPQNKKRESVERMLYELSIFRHKWVEPVIGNREYVSADEVFQHIKDSMGYRYSRNTFMNLWILSNSLEPFIGKGAQNILAMKIGSIRYEGARI